MKARIAIGLGGVALVAFLAVLGRPHDTGPRPAAERPTLAMLTSLPLMFGESFGLSSGGSPALTRLEQRYNVQPIGVADDASLAGQRLLLMAHPRAQPASALVDLDRWVRGGGRLLLLADPRLDWPSERELGDRLRPPPDFADTGLLRHWGIVLSGPDREGRGTLTAPACRMTDNQLVAHCRIGKGAVTVVGDADWLNVPATDPKLDRLDEELGRLETL